MRNTLPIKPHMNESGIVNLEPSSKLGSHWVAYKKRGHTVYYFDSFGDLRPSQEIIRYFKSSRLLYNYQAYQTFESVICGHLCLLFLLTPINSHTTMQV